MDFLNWILCEFLYSFKESSNGSYWKENEEKANNTEEHCNRLCMEENIKRRLEKNMVQLDRLIETTTVEIKELSLEQEELHSMMMADVSNYYDEKLPVSVYVKGIYQQMKALENQINYKLNSVQKMLTIKTYVDNYFHARNSFKTTQRIVTDLVYLMGGSRKIEKSKTDIQDITSEMQKIEGFIETISQPFDGKDLIQKEMESEKLEDNIKDYLSAQLRKSSHQHQIQNSCTPTAATTTTTTEKIMEFPKTMQPLIKGDNPKIETTSCIVKNDKKPINKPLPGRVAVAAK